MVTKQAITLEELALKVLECQSKGVSGCGSFYSLHYFVLNNDRETDM